MKHEYTFLLIIRWVLRIIFPLMIILTVFPSSWAFFISTSIIPFIVFMIGIFGSTVVIMEKILEEKS